MSDRWPGGIISPVAPTPTGGGAGDYAPGIWTIEQAASYIANQEWPGTGTPDPQFQYVTALLHGDGINAGQNNTFLDSSSNNFTITRNGNTTQGSFSPYGNLWSNYLSGASGNYLSVANNANLIVGSGDFTIECWVNMSAVNSGNANPIISKCASNSTTGWLLASSSGGLWQFGDYFGNNLIRAGSVAIGQWTHLAVTRSGSTVTLWVNGSSVGTASYSTNFSDTATLMVGYSADYVYTNAYISNVRLVKGTALYSSAFTPSTTPLTAITNTQLLTCQSNRFIDNSTNNFAITVNGTPSVQRFSPFQNLATYQPATVGGSGYFDGSGDYLVTTPDSSSFNLGTGDFTIECWYYITTLNSNNYILDMNDNGTRFQIFSNNLYMIPASGNFLQTALGCVPNTWTHIAMVRQSGTLYGYVNGVSFGNTSNTSNLTDPRVTLGQYGGGGINFTGYITNFRIVKGSAVYPNGTTFTTPTLPLSNISNTLFLANFTNAAIVDSDATNNLETVGNAQISTSVVKYGTGSLAFDGSGDRLVTVSKPPLLLGSGNFTVEMWLYKNANTAYMTACGNFATASTNTWQILGDAGGTKIGWYNGATNSFTITSNTTIATGAWYHIAFVRAGTNFYLFVNGNLDTSTTLSTNYNATTQFFIGQTPELSAGRDWNGYIDEFRITNGYARYWYNFQPPTKAFPNYGGTVVQPAEDPLFEYNTLLLSGNGTNGAQNNTFLDSSTNNFTITRNGNTTQGSFSPYGTLWSNYFDGSGDYLTVPDNNVFSLGTNDFTIEFWIFPQSGGGSSPIFLEHGQQGDWGAWLFEWASKGDLFFRAASSATAGSYDICNGSLGALTANTWTHIAVTRSGSTFTGYKNGTSVFTSTNSGSIQNQTVAVTIGRHLNSTSNDFNGYLSNVRIVNGTAVYTGAFTPSTTPLTAVTNTALLTCQSNRFIDNSSNAFAVTVFGNPSVQRFSPFEPTAPYSTSVIGGSGYFDGSGDYLVTADNSAFALGTGDFTLECWVYAPNVTTDQQFFNNLVNSGGGNAQWGLFLVSGTVRFSGWTSTYLTGAITANQWNHVAVSRSGTNLSLFVNGFRLDNQTNSNDFSSTNGVRIGAFASGSGPFTGYISNARVVKGTAVYNPASTTITVPTSPLTAITNTSLLTNFTNAGIADLAMQNNLETVGNAQVSTAQSKFGGSSLYFDGTGDWLQLPITPQLYLGTTYTIEAWIYPDSFSKVRSFFNISEAFQGGFSSFGFETNTSGTIIFNVRTSTGGGVTSITGSNLSLNTWQHIALSVNATSARLFVNGNQVGSTTTLPEYPIAKTIFAAVGGWGNGWDDSVAGPFSGYIADFRITRGIARYVQPFTPPTQAFQTY